MYILDLTHFVFHQILQEIKNNGIKIYTLPDVDEDEDADYKEEVNKSQEYVHVRIVLQFFPGAIRRTHFVITGETDERSSAICCFRILHIHRSQRKKSQG